MSSQCSGTKTQEEYTRPAKTVDRSEESALKLWTIKRRREITVETTQQIVISKPQDVVVAWCRACADHENGHIGEHVAIEAQKPVAIFSPPKRNSTAIIADQAS